MKVLLLPLLALILTGCGSSEPLEPPAKTYRVSDRQLPPDPTYNRLRWVHLPETHPTRDLHPISHSSRPKLLPIVHFSIENKPLCEAAAMLAALGRYSSYCSSLVKDRTITLKALGTIIELAERIEAEHPVQVIIDHDHRQVRFLAKQGSQERFFGEDSGE
jgi:hypothetical protein